MMTLLETFVFATEPLKPPRLFLRLTADRQPSVSKLTFEGGKGDQPSQKEVEMKSRPHLLMRYTTPSLPPKNSSCDGFDPGRLKETGPVLNSSYWSHSKQSKVEYCPQM